MTTTTEKNSAILGKSHTVSRVFDAPRDLVWKANTEPERMAAWFAPEGFKGIVKRSEFRPGGVHHYCLRSPDGAEMWGKLIYREILPQEKLVYIQSFSDADGNISTHPMSPTWPREMYSILRFDDLGGGRTRMSVEWAPYNVSAGEQATFDAALSGVDEGWKGTFDKLAEYLADEQR